MSLSSLLLSLLSPDSLSLSFSAHRCAGGLVKRSNEGDIGMRVLQHPAPFTTPAVRRAAKHTTRTLLNRKKTPKKEKRSKRSTAQDVETDERRETKPEKPRPRGGEPGGAPEKISKVSKKRVKKTSRGAKAQPKSQRRRGHRRSPRPASNATLIATALAAAPKISIADAGGEARPAARGGSNERRGGGAGGESSEGGAAVAAETPPSDAKPSAAPRDSLADTLGYILLTISLIGAAIASGSMVYSAMHCSRTDGPAERGALRIPLDSPRASGELSPLESPTSPTSPSPRR